MTKQTIKRGQIWWANLDPTRGTEPGKIRPVVVIQTDLLNSVGHPSTIICPITTNLSKQKNILRVGIPKGSVIPQDSEILVDQIRAIDNTRLSSQAGMLPTLLMTQLMNAIKAILEL